MTDLTDATSTATPAPPTGVDAVTTSVAGLDLHAWRGGDGPPVVVLHHSFGSPGWTALHDALAGHATVWAPDLPGFGASERPAWARHPRDLALLVGHWMRRVGADPAAVVGCGFGGWVAAELATMRPEHCSHLVLVGAAGLLPEEGRILDQILISHSEYVRAAFADERAYEAVYGAALTDQLLLDWDQAREMTTRVAWKPYMYDRQMAPLLAEVDVPTLVVWGGDDQVVPRTCARQYAALLPRARLEVVDGCGHAVDLERPAELAALIRAHLGG